MEGNEKGRTDVKIYTFKPSFLVSYLFIFLLIIGSIFYVASNAKGASDEVNRQISVRA
jgi:hypothetical protein